MTRHWLNLLGILAVWMVVTALICVTSVMKAFDVQFRERIRGTLSDLILEPWPGLGTTFPDYVTIMSQIEGIPEVVACSPQFDGIGLVRLGPQSRPCEFHGIDLSREIKTTEFLDYWQTWRANVAKEALQALFPPTDAPIPSAPPVSALTPLLNRLRVKDFDLLDNDLRNRISDYASRNNISLDESFETAQNARPDWGNVEEPNVSPVIPGANMLLLGKDIQDRIVQLEMGERILLISLPPTTTGSLEQRILRRCEIVGAFHSGMYEFDANSLYLPLKDVQAIMGYPDEITSLVVRLDTFDNAELARSKILGVLTPGELDHATRTLCNALGSREKTIQEHMRSQTALVKANASEWFAVGDYRAVSLTLQLESQMLAMIDQLLSPAASPSANVSHSKALQDIKTLIADRDKAAVSRKFQISTWEDKRRSFLRAVYIERRIMAFILVFVSLIAGFLVYAILYTTVLVKTKDIGIMKAIGGSVRGIQWIFILNGLLIATIGSVLGTISALVITTNINEIEALLTRVTGFTLWPGDIYYLDKIPVDKDPTLTVVMVILTVFAVSLLGSAYPAFKAAHMDPVEALRYE
jgi:ABC-type lipoprotein release transport system permease subunit